MNPDDVLALGLPDAFLRTAYDTAEIVIVDGPALSDSAAAMVLPRNLDAALVVAASGESSQAELRRVVERLEVAPASILGVVINKSPERARRGKSGRRRSGVRPLARGEALNRGSTPRGHTDVSKAPANRQRSQRRRTPRSQEPNAVATALNPVNEDQVIG
jgi:hypothetical protein